MNNQPLDTTRRKLIVGAAGLVIGVILPTASPRSQSAGLTSAKASETPTPPGRSEEAVPLNAYVRVGTDDRVTVVIKHIEMGQGSYTGLATLVAEELDADWADVEAVSAPADAALYGNSVFGGAQLTGGSSAMASSFDLMRRAGATARAMLVEAAARRWGLRANELHVEKGVISHPASNRSGRFGTFAADAASLPVPQDVQLKPPAGAKEIRTHGPTYAQRDQCR
jgi:isoquinoline 1-oxidoreductase subunit beta